MSEDSPTYKPQQLVSGRKLAKILGYEAPSYIAKLKQQGVLSKCYVQQPGKKHALIDVEIAVQEIEASRDPSKEYVRQRWTDYRNGEATEQNTQANKTGNTASPSTGDKDAVGQGGGSDADRPGVGTQQESKQSDLDIDATQAPVPEKAEVLSFQDAKTRKEVYLAKKAQLEYEQAAGQLVNKKLVQVTAADCANIIREGLNPIADRLSQVLAAETDPVQIHAQLTDEFSKVLNALSDRIDRQFVARSQ